MCGKNVEACLCITLWLKLSSDSLTHLASLGNCFADVNSHSAPVTRLYIYLNLWVEDSIALLLYVLTYFRSPRRDIGRFPSLVMNFGLLNVVLLVLGSFWSNKLELGRLIVLWLTLRAKLVCMVLRSVIYPYYLGLTFVGVGSVPILSSFSASSFY